MKLVIDAITTRPSGTLTSLIGYLRAWTQSGAPFDVTVLAGVPASIELLNAARVACRVEPVLAGQSVWRRRLWLTTGLPRWIRRHGSDVLIAGTYYLGSSPIPQVVHHHNLWRYVTADLGVPPRRSLAERMRDRSARRGLSRAAGNVFVSQFLRAQAERFDAARSDTYYVMPNGVDDEVVAAEMRAHELRGSPAAPPARLIAVQSANVQKDNETLLRALAHLLHIAPQIDWQLQIAGSAGRAAWAPYHELARQLGVYERISWLGFLGPDALRAHQRAALCLVATSRFESSGLPLIEAMSASCPVVASSIPAFVEYAQGAAELVPPGDSGAFAERVLQLWEECQRREDLIAEGLQRAYHYRWSQWAPVMSRAVQAAAERGARA